MKSNELPMYIYSQKARLTEMVLRFFLFWIRMIPKVIERSTGPGEKYEKVRTKG